MVDVRSSVWITLSLLPASLHKHPSLTRRFRSMVCCFCISETVSVTDSLLFASVFSIVLQPAKWSISSLQLSLAWMFVCVCVWGGGYFLLVHTYVYIIMYVGLYHKYVCTCIPWTGLLLYTHMRTCTHAHTPHYLSPLLSPSCRLLCTTAKQMLLLFCTTLQSKHHLKKQRAGLKVRMFADEILAKYMLQWQSHGGGRGIHTAMRVGGACTLSWGWAGHTHSHGGGRGILTPMRVGGAYTFLDYTGLRLGNGHAEVGVSTSHMEVRVASSHMEVRVTTSHMEVGVASSHMEVCVATSHMEVVCATYILPCPPRSCTMWMGQYRPMWCTPTAADGACSCSVCTSALPYRAEGESRWQSL